MVTANQSPSDAELWNAFRRGDSQAYESIYRRYSPALFSYGKRLTSDYDLVRDTVQDVFVEIWQRRENLTDLQTIKFYLFRVFRNAITKTLKRHEEPFDWGQVLSGDFLSPSAESLLTEEENYQDRMGRLRKGIDQLPGRQKEAIMLCFFDDMSNEEIALVMGIQSQSVINHLSRALQFLRDTVVGWIMMAAWIEF
ncbi:RNA polymerase sigma factor [Siphonobacter aquaeclarae]|jgi:RNA polymerase sigma factor (sigma-70 family)|uniref:Sigma-70 region 2 n=1 Tax=Siphonobacter aquaeclarae TaxID=563176 RepID=A0A1G9VFU7_9BACT|nr:sigma-70 family RNA polymerase sigma factor [Siphonobacter aquaeclarae]MBO9637080.1 sigma-70 family RNA polymerase sigma factor [Siphonobacter aquaeclarae]SDM70953.1 Sigma-70 region 2 [Siphonobacter aquaeclarae]